MGRAVVYCEKCGELISEEDFLNGKAVTSGEKNYCRKCKSQVADVLPDEPQAPKSGSSRNMASPSAEAKTASRIIRKQGTGVYKKTGSGIRRAVQSPAEDSGTFAGESDEASAPRGGARKSNMPVFAAIGGVIVIIIVAVIFLTKSGSGSSPAEKSVEAQKAEDDERQRLSSAVSAYGSDPEKVLRAIDDATPKLKSDKNKQWIEELKKEWTRKSEARKNNEKIIARKDELEKKAKDPNEDAGSLILQWEELCSDPALRSYGDLKELARSLADIRRRLSNSRVGQEIAKVDAYATQNPDAYQEIANKYLDILDFVETEPPSNEAMDKINKNLDKFAGPLGGRWTKEELEQDIKAKRDKWLADQKTAGEKAIAALNEEVNGLLKENKVDEAIAKAREFPKKYGGTFSQQAENMARNIEEQRKTANNPPQNPQDPPRQGERTVSLVQGWKVTKTSDNIQASWENKDGAMVGTFKGFIDPKAVQQGLNMTTMFFEQSNLEEWKDYDLNFEFKVAKHDFQLVLWMKRDEKNSNITLMMLTDMPIKENEWYSATIRVQNNVAKLTIKDKASRMQTFQLDPGCKSWFGFMLSRPEAEVHLRFGQATVRK
jgi:hypothetical protein